jgi:hypothetical protein
VKVRLVTLVFAAAICALWPQGLVLCVGGQGHIDFEFEGAPCCPEDEAGHGDEEDRDCANCRDYGSPDLATAGGHAALPTPAPAAAVHVDAVPEGSPPATVHATPPRPDLAALRSVLLVI